MSIEEYMYYKKIDDDIRSRHMELMRSDPLYGLMSIPVDENRLSLMKIRRGNGLYIAGGAVLYLIGVTKTYSDIDYFTTNKKTAEDILYEWVGRATQSSNAVTSNEEQIITRLYTYPAQIVYGFDVGCCAVMYDTTTGIAYATQKALYCIHNKVNCIEIDRASPSYIGRLCKYAGRGFKILMPNIEGINWNVDAVADIKVKLINELTTGDLRDTYPIVNVDVDDFRKNGGHVSTDKSVMKSKELMELVDDKLFLKYYLWDKDDACFRACGYNKMFRELLPSDKASRLLMIASLGIGPVNDHVHSDYEQRPDGFKSIKDVKWNTVDPMKQLTGTFNPKSIDDLRKFYLSSPLVTIESGVPIVSIGFREHHFKSIKMDDVSIY